MVFLSSFLQEHDYAGAEYSKEGHLIWAGGKRAAPSQTEVSEGLVHGQGDSDCNKYIL